jgi:WD40 repeat protein
MLFLNETRGRTECLAFSANGEMLATGGSLSPAVRLWDLDRGQLRGVLQPPPPRSGVAALLLTPDASRLVVGHCVASPWYVWDTARRQIVSEMRAVSPTARWLALLPDGRTVVGPSRQEGNQLVVPRWDLATGVVQSELRLNWGVWGAQATALSGDGQFLALAGSGGSAVKLYHLETGKERPTPSVPLQLGNLVCFAPDLQTLFAVRSAPFWGVRSAQAALWDLAAGSLRARLEVHARSIPAAAFSPDCRFLVTGGSDEVVRLWDVSTGSQRAAFDWKIGRVCSVAFAADGFRAGAGGKKAIVLWDVDS